MIKKLSHLFLFVLNQEKSLSFFVDKLGFEKRDDKIINSNVRWLTVAPILQNEIEIVLHLPGSGLINLSQKEQLSQVGKQPGFYFACESVQLMYKKLKEQGVKVLGEPEKDFWGTKVFFEDLYGNIHLMIEPR